MPSVDHRAPGLIVAALEDPRVTVGMIPDGIHVAPPVVALAWRSVGPDRFSVVTDAMAALGKPPGRFRLGTIDVDVDATSARLADGRLAGSIVDIGAAVRNLMTFTGCTAADAVGSVTSVPARLLGLGHERGALGVGSVADVTLLAPDMQIAGTIVGGLAARLGNEGR
jgi:N-acetylglucosamine-6-phosphate deacetylase